MLINNGCITILVIHRDNYWALAAARNYRVYKRLKLEVMLLLSNRVKWKG